MIFRPPDFPAKPGKPVFHLSKVGKRVTCNNWAYYVSSAPTIGGMTVG